MKIQKRGVKTDENTKNGGLKLMKMQKTGG